jgi:Outer membrane protein beta-barrel domain
MRKLSLVLIAVVALSLCGFAQDKVQVYGGYSLFRLDSNAAPADRNLNGWDGEIAGKLAPFLSIVGDVGGQYHTQNVLGSDVKTSVYSFLAGPRVSFTTGKITPFANVLFGVAHSKADVTGFGSSSDNNFATAIGGGVDIKVAPYLSLRPAKLDYLLVKTDPNNITDINGNGISHTNNLRYSAGVVFHF